MMARPRTGKAVTVHKLSGSFDSIALEEYPIPELKPSEILVKFLAAPINPSDLMYVSGEFGLGPPTPFIAGFECVAEVIETGSAVSSVKVNEWVSLFKPGIGSWRDFGAFEASDAIKVDKSLGFEMASTISANPPTAYFLLKENNIKSGETLIQNGANSMVGKAIIQLAKSMGIKTINIVRNRANLQELVDELKELGADQVLTDDKIKEAKFEEKPVLGIDCVGGEAAAAMIDHLEENGTLVNYGVMSGQPIMVPPLALTFKNIVVKGFSLLRAMQKYPGALQSEVIPYITKLVAEGKFKPPNFELFYLDDFKQALERASSGFSNKKQLLVMDKNLMK